MKQTFYIGNYSNDGIYILEFDNGNLNKINSTCDEINCSYLCKHNNSIYNVVETLGDDYSNGGYIVSHTQTNSLLKPQSKKTSYGKAPCFVTVDKKRNILYVANYVTGSFSAFSINSDGSIGNNLYVQNFDENSHVHCIAFSNDNNYVFIIDLGNNKLIAYKIEFSNGSLTLNKSYCYQFASHSEPRHLVIDNKDNLYVITESSCEIYKIHFSPVTGFSLIISASILPKNITKEPKFTGCALKLSSDYKFLYTSIRGYDSISVFDLSKSLDIIQTLSCHGKTPRDISFDKNEDFLICANQLSDSLSIFSRDKETGILEFYDLYSITSPSCILVKN